MCLDVSVPSKTKAGTLNIIIRKLAANKKKI